MREAAGGKPVTEVSERALADLMQAAREAMSRAYAPYSGFPVGAAVLADNGVTHVGVNVENVSYPLAVCAERTAVGTAVATGARRLLAVAVASQGEPPATPCGACRQVLAEFNPSLVVLVGGPSGPWAHYTLDQLLPHPFLHGGATHGV